MGSQSRKVGPFLLILTLFSVRAYYGVLGNASGYGNDTSTSKQELSINDEFRLPDSLAPEFYDIKYNSVDMKNFNFSGSVRIRIRVVKKTREIVLHKGEINVTVTNVREISAKPIELVVETTNFNKTTNKFSIILKDPVKSSRIIEVNLKFDGFLRDDMLGFYRSSYFDKNGTQKWLASTKFSKVYARSAFPCFDEPAFKAIFNISIQVPDGYHCLGNMPFKMDKTNKWCKFESTVKMSSYLVAFVISDFKALENANSTMSPAIKVWSRPDVVSQGKYALGIGQTAVGFLESKLKSKYQLPKLDMMAVPDFASGAMENWGLITYRENKLLHHENMSSDISKQQVALTVVHEITHMWFGNLVTPQWWSYLWLSEGFAAFFQYMATNEVEKNWRTDYQFLVDKYQLALEEDSYEDTVPLTRSMSTQQEIGKAGGIITYAKGASIIRMMEHAFGTDVFYDSLKLYLEKNQYGTVTPEHLWSAFQTTIDKKDPKPVTTVSDIMKNWTEKPGYPCVKVSVNGDKIILEQGRFFLRKPETIPASMNWAIPISFRSSSQNTNDSTEPQHWLSDARAELKNQFKYDDWFIVNVQSAGYYRVNYDRSSWEKIIKVLTSGEHEKIPVLSRAAILDDLLNLARAELVDYNLVLTAVSYLRNETEYLPFKAALRGLNHLRRMFSTSQHDKTFKEFMNYLLTQTYKKVKFNDERSDDHMKILLRQEIIAEACKVDHPECIFRAQEQFNDCKSYPKPVPKNSRSTVYCTAVKYGPTDNWDFIWKNYLESDVADERVTILKSLGCSKNTTILQSYLLSALKGFKESRIRKQDISTVYTGVYSSSYSNAYFMLEFIEDSYGEIYEYHKNNGEVAKIITNILKMYPSEKVVSKVKKIMEKITDLKDINESVEKAIKQTKREIEWFKRNSKTIIDWIRTYRQGDGFDNTKAYRLPKNVIPTSYAIHLTPYIEPGKFNFTGKVLIHAEVKESTDVITMHSDQLEVLKDNLQVRSLDDHKVNFKVLNLTYVEKYDFLNIKLDSVIPNGMKISIRIYYKGNLTHNLGGFYRSSYTINNETRWLAATQLEPTGARRVFPCFDEPALKATFNVSVRAPQGYSVLSNERGVAFASDNSWIFQTTPKMSTYLVAVVVSDFESEELFVGKRYYKVWGNPLTKKYKQLKYALDTMNSSVSFFEEKLGIPYEFSKMDMVALPDFKSGGMENWGLITYRETALTHDPQYVSPVTSKQGIHNVIYHEIAHQWFGDLVSPLWWDYLWLSEGFAKYFQYHAHSENENSWNVENQFVVEHLQMSFSKDASEETHPVTANVYSPVEIKDIFDPIPYGKAASLIRMLEKLVGQKIFYSALSNYLKSCTHSSGTPELLFEAFQDEMKKQGKEDFDVAEVMNTWTTQPGFPVLNVKFDDDGKVHLSQSRFYSKPLVNETDKSTWIIPINWATKSHPDFDATAEVIWMNNENEKEIPLKRESDDWVIFNIQQTGYYRVNYDTAMWKRLIDVLRSGNFLLIHEGNRASLIDDLFNLGRAGLVDYDLVFSAFLYLRNETALVPWKAALANLNYFRQRFTGRSEIYSQFKNFVVHLLEPLYRDLKFDDAAGDSHTKLLLRKLMLEWLCDLGFEDCVKKAHKLYDDYRYGANIPSNKRAAVYSTAIKYGKPENWDYLWGRLTSADNATEKQTIMNALACSPEPDNLKKLLLLASTEGTEVRLQDADTMFLNVVNNGPIGVETTLDFVAVNYQKMREYFGGDDTTKSVLSSIGLRLTTPSLRSKFKGIVKRASKDMPSIAESLQNYLNRDSYEMSWLSTYGSRIFRWLDTYEPIIKDATNYRLPKSVVPESYDISLQPSDNGSNLFRGISTIDVKILDNTYKIVLHHRFQDAIFWKIDPPEYEFWEDRAYNQTTDQLTIRFKQLLTAGSKLQLKFDYLGKMGQDDRGYYKSHYVDANNTERWLTATQFEPTYARRAFPCFDEPSFKANFTIHLSKPEGYHTLSNMGSKPVEEVVGNLVWDHYETSPKMSPYTVAFIVSDFVKVQADGSNVAVWGRENLAKYLNEASKIGHETMKHLNSLTQIPYSLKEMNFVAVPDSHFGAMENWGLVTFEESYLVYDETRISAQNLEEVVKTIVHELAHMWFGNLVTCDWWDYAWLNEGLATFFEFFVGDTIRPEWHLMDQFVATGVHHAMSIDSSESSHAMNNKVLKPTEILDSFDEIAYQKAGSILRMFHKSFGWWVFSEALHNYLDARKYNTARPEHFIEAFQARAEYWGIMGDPEGKLDARTIMDSWLSQPGYPVVNATRVGNTVTLAQERFLTSMNTSTSLKDVTYWIPITYTSEDSPSPVSSDPKFWLGSNNSKIDLTLGDSWYLLNVDGVGFYRVNYDKENWNKLTQLLNSSQFSTISVVNRAQLIDDSLNLARAGYIDYETALGVTQYLTREGEFVPWKSFFRSIGYVALRVRGNGKIEDLFANYMRTLIQVPYKRVGFTEDLLKDKHTDQLVREIILMNACKYGYEDCSKMSQLILAKKERVSPNIAPAVFCSYIEHGGLDEWNGLWNSFEDAELPTDKKMYLQSLGCSKDDTVLEKYLSSIFSSTMRVRRQDRNLALESISSYSEVGLMTAMTYLQKNLPGIYRRYNDWDEVGSLFVKLSNYISTTEQYNKLNDIATNTNVTEIKPSLQKALRIADANMKWFKRYSDKIYSWLENNYPLPTPDPSPPDDNSTLNVNVILIIFACLAVVGALIFGLTMWYKRSTR